MGSASFAFLGFSVCVIAVFNLSRAVVWRQFILLAASLLFLTFFSRTPSAWIPFAAFIGFGFCSLRLLQRGVGGAGFVPLIIACIFAFVWLKKYAFVPHLLFLQHPYVTLGLSYIFFRMLLLLIDAHAGQIRERVSVVNYLTYTLNFTTLISGPIQNYQEFSRDQLAARPLRLDIFDAGVAIERIVTGFFKVNVLSLLLSTVQADMLNTLSANSSFEHRWLQGIVIVGIYPLYLYCNFSGYIDIVIGIARFLRLELPENFDRPFSAPNFMLFWNRWHMTLTNWLRRYVFNPLLLAMVRRFQSAAVGPYLAVPAIFVTFFLVGLWHGQTSEFLLYGVLQGGGVASVQLYQTAMIRNLGKARYRSLAANPWYVIVCRGLTFAWFSVTLLWFWSNWHDIDAFAAKLGAPVAAAAILGLIAAAAALLAGWEVLRKSARAVRVGDAPLLGNLYTRLVIGTTLAVLSVATVALVNAPAPDLIYKAF